MKIIYSKTTGKRKVGQANIFQKEKIYKEKRKIGGIEVYVDEKQRTNYVLEDCASYI